MPHIVIEVSSGLAARIDWQAHIPALHASIADRQLALLGDLKTRVLPCHFTACGEGCVTEQIVAKLTMTNERTKAAQAAMADLVLQALSRALRQAHQGSAQICVFHEFVPKSQYHRRDFLAA